MTECCGTCLTWQPSKNPKHSKVGKCPMFGDKWPENKCPRWGWVQASKEQLESRVKAGLIEEVGA